MLNLCILTFDIPGTYRFDVETTSLTYIPSKLNPTPLSHIYTTETQTQLTPKTVGIGAASSGLISLYYDTIYEKAKKQGKSWTCSPELHRLPVSCIAGPCLTISLFWLGWTATRNIHWIVPVLSGVLFGIGYQMIFISLLTYVTDAYKIYSASALAASVILRSIVGALFPLAADPLYSSLGVGWATSVLGFVSLACIPIPFGLLYVGPWIRKRSPFCQRLLEEDLLKEGGEGRPLGTA
jgi:hypothetical protein